MIAWGLGDRIDLSAIDADSSNDAGGVVNDAFVFDTDGTLAGGEIAVSRGTWNSVAGTFTASAAGGDVLVTFVQEAGAADVSNQIVVTGVTSLTATDFVL